MGMFDNIRCNKCPLSVEGANALVYQTKDMNNSSPQKKRVQAMYDREKLEKTFLESRYQERLRNYQGFIPKPGSLWLVVYECRYNVIAVSADGHGFFAPGQGPMWWFDSIQEWVKEIEIESTNEQSNNIQPKIVPPSPSAHRVCIESVKSVDRKWKANRFSLWLNRITSDIGCTSTDARVLRKANHHLSEENCQLRAALQDLVDEQNGAPLLRYEKQWQAAMDTARSLLEMNCDHRQNQDE